MRLYRFPRYLIVRYYKLGDFHISTKYDKKYVASIQAYLNQRTNRNSVIEIGVGLGDILLGLDFKYLTAADHKQQVLDALKFRVNFMKKSKKKIIFKKIKIETNSIDGKYDVIILVNFIHNIPTETLSLILEQIYHNNLLPGGEIIFDSIISKNELSPYPYAHQPEKLNKNLNGTIKCLGKFLISPKLLRVYRGIYSIIKT